MTAPSILVIDDGELDRLQPLLGGLQVDWVRCSNPSGGDPLEKPLDLIISSGPRAMKMPALFGDRQPLWLCLYDQNFLPLREQLRDRGVHYLVAGDLAPRTLELFLRQLLHRGEERRQVRRIPLHCGIELHVGSERRKAQLLELSRDSCVIAVREPVPQQRRVTLRLPADLIGDGDLDVSGSVLRANGGVASDGERAITTVLRFESLDADAMARIHYLLSGNALATQVTPLHAEPSAPVADAPTASWLGAGHVFDDVQPERSERRKADRQPYERPVEAIHWYGPGKPQVVLGRDLSRSGLCIVSSSPPVVSSDVSLALYGRAREEPLLVRARVTRVDGDEVGLRFVGVTLAQARALERMIAATPCVEDLSAHGSRHVVELTRR